MDTKDLMFRKLFSDSYEEYILEVEDEIVDKINNALKSWSDGYDKAYEELEEGDDESSE